jgi:hypothetical protein
MARKDFKAMRSMVGNPLFAGEIFGFHGVCGSGAQRSGQMESEAPIDRLAAIVEVEQLMTTVASLAR